jgi:hypothetical protein
LTVVKASGAAVMPHENRQEPRIAFFAPNSLKFRTMTTRVQTAITVIWTLSLPAFSITLVVHILLSMLGAGIGTVLIEVGTHTLDEVYKLSWVAFAGGRSRESSQLM